MNCHYGSDGAVEHNLGWIVSASGQEAWITFYIPDGFKALSEAELIIRAGDNIALMEIAVTSWFGGMSESYDTHTDSVDCMENVLNNYQYGLNILDALTGLAAGDLLLIRAEYKTNTNCRVVGVRLKYTVA